MKIASRPFVLTPHRRHLVWVLATLLVVAVLPLSAPQAAHAATTPIKALTVQGTGDWAAGWQSLAFTPENTTEFSGYGTTPGWGLHGRAISTDHSVTYGFFPPIEQRF